MRLFLANSILIFLVFLQPLFSFGTKTPLSQYSSQWDNKYFDKANTTSIEYYLTDNEKEFIYILNLARLSPLLFKKSVIIPYCEKIGYSAPAYALFNKIGNVNNFSLLFANLFYKKEAKNLLENKRINNYNGVDSSDDLVFEKKEKIRGAYLFSKTDRAIDVILKLLTDGGNSGKRFREIIFGDYSDVGVCIKNHPYKGFATVLLADKLTDDQRSALPVYYNINPTTLENYKLVNYNEQSNDPVLNYFINKHGLDLQNKKQGSKDQKLIGNNSVFADLESIKKTEDSLLKNGITFSSKSFDYDVNLTETQYKRRNNIIPRKDYCFSESSFSLESNINEAEKRLDLYYIGRTIEEPGKKSIVKISILRTPDPQPPFPIDSIGVFDTNTSLKNVDDYIYSLRNYDTTNLAIIITKPFKSELEKVRAIFIWLNANIHYDYIGLENNRTTVEVNDVLTKRVAVCDGYARLFHYLCSKAGITSEYISGTSQRGLHAWNAVRIDKKWYLVDATWGPKYFLLPPEYFIKEHFPAIRKWALMSHLITKQEWNDKYLESKK